MRFVRFLVALTAAASLTLGLCLPVGAYSPGPAVATVPSSADNRQSAAPTTASVGGSQHRATPDQPAEDQVIVCTPNVQNPHNSSHEPGTVNVVVTLTCVGTGGAPPPPEIQIDAALYYNGYLVSESGYQTVYDSYYAQTNAAVPCAEGYYVGWMAYYVEFPPGFEPPTGSSSGFGNEVYITC